MSITDELRDWMRVVLTDDDPAHAIADRIDAEHQKAIRELNNLADASVLLPVDADGEVIHVGDAMERGDAHGRVIALMLSNYPKKWGGGLHWSIQLEGEQAPIALDLTFHHYHAPTVEDVLRKCIGEAFDAQSMYVAESIGREEYERELERLVEKVAEEIRGLT